MRKHVFALVCFLLVFITVVSVSGCSDSQTGNSELIRLTLESADELNRNSDFGPFSGLLMTKGVRMIPEMRSLDNRIDHCTITRFDGKPRITQITLTTSDYHVFGIRVGDDINSADDVMTAFGYTKQDDSDDQLLRYEKHYIGITFHFQADDQLISGIFIGASDHLSDGRTY